MEQGADGWKAEIAAVAARLVVDDGLEYGPAKRQALRVLGLPTRTPLPGNDLLEEAVFEHIAATMEQRVGPALAGIDEALTSPGKPAEVKITLPSYQVGIYKDPRFPFKIHCYNGREGFNLFEVQRYYGGAELVPEECKRVYIENDLCYDVRTVIRAIQSEHRQLQLIGRVK